MARANLNLQIVLNNVHCHDEGDGWGNAEPYLWPVFFKIDGDCYAVEPGSGLIGFPIVSSRDGHHGNLGNTDVDAGDDVSVPEALGIWQDTLKPIPVNDPVLKLKISPEDHLAGIAGVAVVLMEEDNWPDSLADTGYNAFVSSVQFAVAKVAAGFQHALHEPTPDEINAAIQTVKDSAASMVHDAVKGTMSGWQLAWFGTFGNNDDTIGSEVWTFTNDDFAREAVIDFSKRWSGDESGDGDWELSGTAVGVPPCPVDALAGFLGGTNQREKGAEQEQRDFAPALAAMRDFREKEHQTIANLESWFRAIQGNMPDIVRIVAREREARDALRRLFAALPQLLAARDRAVPVAHLRDVATLLQRLSKASPRMHRAFAGRALEVLAELEGQTGNGAIERITRARPSGRERSRPDASTS